jgi:hypothetical protein
MTIRKLIRVNQRAYAVRENRRIRSRELRKARAAAKSWPGYWIGDLLSGLFLI